MKLTNESENLIEAFVKSFKDAGQALAETGRLLVKIVDTVPNGIDRLIDRLPGLSPYTVKFLLAVGRGQVLEQLCLSESPGVLRLRECDVAVQRRHIAEPIPLLIYEGGKTSHLLVSVFDMSMQHSKQAFGRGFVRTLEQQRQWMEGQKPKITNIAMDRPYTVRRGKIIFHKPCELTLQQLASLTAEAAGA